MDPDLRGAFDLSGLLHLSQRWGARKIADQDADVSYRDLLRYTLQIAAEREVAAEVLAELRELLEEYAPDWYAADQHERVESTLELLQRL